MHNDTLKGSLLGCFEYVPYTGLTIVLIIKTINVRLIEFYQIPNLFEKNVFNVSTNI